LSKCKRRTEGLRTDDSSVCVFVSVCVCVYWGDKRMELYPRQPLCLLDQLGSAKRT